MDWTDGYVSDVDYTSGIYKELAPSWLAFVAALQGVRAPDPGAPYTYCDLGCGHGDGTNVLAAANPHARFVGIDFNPAHIANARAMAEAASLENVTFREEGFHDTASLPAEALPDFDFIVLHGIYSWVSQQNREAVIRLISKRLKPGGLVYVSYNCLPGWAQAEPLQRLLVEHAARHPDRSDKQVRAGFDFAEDLRAANLRYFRDSPGVATHMDAMRDKNAHYLAHEYLNRAWTPLYSTDVAAEMGQAKLDFVGSARILENFDTLSIPEAARPAIRGATDGPFRELLKDYALNRQFRADIFVKGTRRLARAERDAALLDRPVQALAPPSRATFTFEAPLGEAHGQPEVYGPLVETVDTGAATVRDIAAKTSLDTPRLVQAVAVLMANGHLHPAGLPFESPAARRLNAGLGADAQSGRLHRFVAAPATGSGVPVDDLDLLVIGALASGTPAAAKPISDHLRARIGNAHEAGPVESDGERFETRIAERLKGNEDVWQSLGLF